MFFCWPFRLLGAGRHPVSDIRIWRSMCERVTPNTRDIDVVIASAHHLGALINLVSEIIADHQGSEERHSC